MKKFSEILKNQKAQFLVLAILLSLLIAVVGFIYYANEIESTTQKKENELKTLASLKSNQISDWLIDELNDAKLISRNIFLVEPISKFLSTKNLNDKERVKKFLIEVKLEHDYHAIILADTNSKILTATEKVFGLDPKLKNSIAIAAKEKKVITSDVYKCSVHHELHIDFVAPVIKEQKVIAVIVFQFNPAQKFFPLLSTSPTESYSTESYIGKKEKDSVVVLSELKFKKDAVLKHKYSIKDTNSAIVKAVNGFTGFTDAIDYRGEEVVAYVNHIAGTNWYMVTKIDKKELYQDLTRESILLITFLIIIIASIFSSIAFIYSMRQRNTYKQLYYSQKEYLVTLNSIGDAVISTDTEGKIKFINQVAEELTGWNHKDAIGKPLEDVFKIINENSREKVDNPVDKVLKEGKVIGIANHTLLVSKEGKEIPIADSGAPIKNDEGEILGVVLVFRDQTKEREAIAKIKKSEFRLNRAEIASKSGNWELHLDTKKIIGSKGACLIYGVNASEFDYETIKKLPLPEYRPKLDEALKNLIEKNIPYEVEFKIRALDSGEIKDIHSIAFYDSERKIIFGIIQDITEKKKLQEALKLSEEKYRTISDLVSDYVFSTIIFDDGTTELDWVAGSFEEITGYTLEEYKLTGGWRGHLHPDDIEKDNEDMKTILNNNKVTTEIRTINKEGSII
ncbi:MAG: PAS domain S-box protein [Ignavibacteriales bacterium]|nr:PAS domain S-box protein [Ignavibacteriales bacterium]